MSNELTWEQQQDNAAYEQWKAEDDWKKYDTQDHEAGAAYYDQLAQEPAVAPKPQRTIIMEAQNHHLALAQRHADEYERMIYRAPYAGDLTDIAAQQATEDRSYKLAVLNASLAQAEAQTRQAEVMETLIEFASDLIGRTDLVNALMQWSYQQRVG